MRSISFRGLRKDNKEHFHGRYVPSPAGSPEHCLSDGDLTVSVYPGSIGQSTGEYLNKEEITEWDVLLWESDDGFLKMQGHFLVIFDQGSFKAIEDVSGIKELLFETISYNPRYETMIIAGTLHDFQDRFPNYHYLAE